MKLIDADKLEYQMLYKENFLKGSGYEAQAIWKEDIDSQPTIDAVPVVRCKDCMYKNVYRFPPEYDERDYCEKHDMVVDGANFCSWAERRIDETD